MTLSIRLVRSETKARSIQVSIHGILYSACIVRIGMTELPSLLASLAAAVYSLVLYDYEFDVVCLFVRQWLVTVTVGQLSVYEFSCYLLLFCSSVFGWNSVC